MPEDEDTDPALSNPLTPCETPDAKRKSGEFAARECPKCGGADVPCTLCIDPKTGKPTRLVSHFKAASWMLENGMALHDSVPPTRPK